MSPFEMIVAFTGAVTLLALTWIPLAIFRTTRFNTSASGFHKTLIPAMEALNNPKSSLKEIIITEFIKQKTAMISLNSVLKFERKRRNRFNEKWTEYEKIANEYLDYDNNIELQNVEYFLGCAKDPAFIKKLPTDVRDKFAAEFLEIEGIRKKYIRGLLESLCDITTKY